MQHVVIIGASHAGAEVVSALRIKGWEGKISLIGDEPELPYQRPPLSKGFYKGDIPKEKLLIKKDSYYAEANVDLHLGCRVTRIDRKNKQVTLDNEVVLNYTKLIIATGTRARQLQIEGNELTTIRYLRTVQDVDSIKEALQSKAHLLIVGAGYIGLEIAASAVMQGLKVTVLEAQERVLARVTGTEISSFYQGLHKSQGVDIRLNAMLIRFVERDGRVFAELKDGSLIETDCAVVGIGVIPNVELAEEAGLTCDNGIVVNEFTQTDDPDIYAVGDCSNHQNFIYDRRVRLESVPNAVAQAKTAALSIVGEQVPYNQLPWFWSDQYDVKLQTAGLVQGYDRTETEGDVESAKFAVSYFRDDKLIAVDAVNSPAQFMRAKKTIMADLATD